MSFREGVTIHRGTVQDRAETTVGDHNLMMAYAHIGHDSVIGNHCILVNNTALAGHVHVGDWAILSGYHPGASVLPYRCPQRFPAWARLSARTSRPSSPCSAARPKPAA